ncbi:hypothetical protein Taro_009664 [Colocasia esculenta]|uniref:Retrotransposon gag domain-containing protein n=1 Tax=Colocasia esculenta TaxID=4460 RepID=A0A843U134_COLES|nr:hypothetical protein [Colocasia esculenta]
MGWGSQRPWAPDNIRHHHNCHVGIRTAKATLLESAHLPSMCYISSTATAVAATQGALCGIDEWAAVVTRESDGGAPRLSWALRWLSRSCGRLGALSVCMCATCSAQGSGRWEGDAQVRRDLIAAPRCIAESGRSRGNARRSLHNAFFAKCVVSLARLRPVRGRRTRVKHVTGLTGLDEAFHYSWYQSKAVVMADRRDCGGGGDDPEESTQRMIERIWESLTDIRMRMDQQAPVPPVIGEAVPVASVLPLLGMEVPFVAPVPPSPLVIAAQEPVVHVERFLRLQSPTYTGGPNPDTPEHWIHEIERVFMTMRCPAADRVLLATYQLRGFAQEWWRLKMQTTFVCRIEGAITWPEFLEVFNDTFFPLQVQQAKKEQFRTLQQGETSVLEYQMRFMALSRHLKVKEEDGDVVTKFSRVVVSQRWRSRSKVPPGSLPFHQAIGVLTIINCGI